MRSVRIEPEQNGMVLLVDIICDCGQNGLCNEATKETGFKHAVTLGGRDIVLVCECGEKYRLHPQRSHIHVSTE